MGGGAGDRSGVRAGTAAGRGVIAAATLGSGMALLDGAVVNVALRTLGRELGADLAALQWITNGYLLSLAALMLLGGSLGDRFGRRRVFLVGVAWFAVASLACGLAPSSLILIVARVLQGAGAALLMPGSLAMIQGSFAPSDRGRAIGAWSGLGGIATAAGPLVGGVLVDHFSWRWVFLINVPIAAATIWTARRFVPESRNLTASGHLDLLGAACAALALAGLTYALISWGSPAALGAAAFGAAAALAFLVREGRTRHPMLPLGLFRDRVFTAANLMTALVYAALGAVLFFLVLQLQTVAGYGALSAGLATLPITVCMLLLAARGGALGARIGPRIPMAVGPAIMAVGTLLLLRVGPTTTYALDVLPALTIFGLGLSLMVAPLTATVLSAAPDQRAGIASGVNNALARTGSLLAVAALPAAVGLSGAQYADPAAFAAGFRSAVVACAALLALGGAVSWLTMPAGPATGPVPR